MVSATESSKFFALFSEKTAQFDRSVASKDIEDCRSLIQESQALVSAHSSVLPPRDLQVYKDRINEFKRLLDSIRQPKKKFGFSRAAIETLETKVPAEKPPPAAVQEAAREVEQKAAFNLENCTGQELKLTNVHGEVELRNLTSCTVRISGNPAALYMSEVHDCQVICDPVASSVLIVGFKGSKLQIACQQLRIHKAENAVFHLHVTSRSIIEDCHNIEFGDLPSDYPASEEAWETSGLSKTNNYKLVDDFNWLNVQEPSPNWKLLE